MQAQIRFHPEVADDIRGSYKWYEEQLSGLGGKFLDELEEGFGAIQNFPDTWANFHYGFRRYILNKFPFSIVYKTAHGKIYIVAVMHNSRKPHYWADRIG